MRWRRHTVAAEPAPARAGERVPRICREVQATLPSYAEGRLGRFRRGAVRQHLARCTACQAALDLQQQMQAVFAPAPEQAPPPELLDTLLAQARRRGLRERAAVPVRGAVSGARPMLSAALLTGAAIAGTGVGWASWQAARRISAGVRRR